jgi:hypothetical protein
VVSTSSSRRRSTEAAPRRRHAEPPASRLATPLAGPEHLILPPPPPTPRSTFPVAGGGWCASYCCERACASVPATLLSTAGLGKSVCQPPYYPRAGLVMPGRAAVRIRSTGNERRWRLLASHSRACRCAALTYYIHAWQYVMTRAATRARGLCESWRCGGLSCPSKPSLHLRRHRVARVILETAKRQSEKLMKLT